MTPTKPSLRTRVAAFSFLILVGLALGALLLEITVRVLYPTSDFFYEWDPVIGMKLVPGKQGRSVKSGLFDVQVQVNSAGFRDRDHDIEKPPGTRRVVLLGDSFLEAMQVRFEDSLTPLLESRLQNSGPTELINLSVSGAGTARQYLALREYGLRYEPDLVLLFFVGNDVSDNSQKLEGLSYIPYPQTTETGALVRDHEGNPVFTPFADQSSRLSSVAGLFRDTFKAYGLLREIVQSSTTIHRILYKLRLISTPPEPVNAPSGDNFGFYEIYRVEPKPVWAEAWHITEQMILAVRDLARSNGAKFGVVLIPAVWDVEPQAWDNVLDRLPLMRETPVDRERPSRLLSEFLLRNDIPVVNLLPELQTLSKSGASLYIHGDAHWTPDGHLAAADLLADPVSQLLTQ